MSITSSTPNKIRDKLDRGALPLTAPEKIYAGHGQGLPCHGCDEPIVPGQVEYEFDMPEGARIRLHIGCAGLWEAERRRRELSRPANASEFDTA